LSPIEASVKSKETGYIATKWHIEEILQREDQKNRKHERGAVKRLAFMPTKKCAALPRPLCLKFYRLLHWRPY
jgi:hypothetical protein